MTSTLAPGAAPQREATTNPAYQGFLLLRAAFTAAPILFGLDKFLGLTVDWPLYLWPALDNILPGTANHVMLAVGVIEIIAGVLVALRPRIGGYVVAGWLGTIIVNLLLLGRHYDVALRDFGLLLGALALARLATAFSDRSVETFA